MLTMFLIGLAAVFTAIAIIAISYLGFKWIKNHIVEKLKKKENHKVAFADTHEILNQCMKQQIEQSETISVDDLERMCEETPFVSACVDKDTGEITDYEGICADEVDERVVDKLHEHQGLLLVEG